MCMTLCLGMRGRGVRLLIHDHGPSSGVALCRGRCVNGNADEDGDGGQGRQPAMAQPYEYAPQHTCARIVITLFRVNIPER